MALNGIPDNDTGYQAPWEEEGETLQQSLEAGSFKKENKLAVGTGDKKEKAPTPKQDETSNPADGGMADAGDARLQEATTDGENDGLEGENGKTGNHGGNPTSDAGLRDGKMQQKTHRGARRTAREIAAKTSKEAQANLGYLDPRAKASTSC